MGSSSETRLAVGLATAIDVVAAAVLLAGFQSVGACWLAGVLHLASAVSLLLVREPVASRRHLLMAFGFAVPIVGPVAAVLSLSSGGQSRSELVLAAESPGDGDDADDQAQRDPSPDPRVIREIAESLALPEALLVAGVEQRRAMLWGLSRRGDAEAVALLRWALTAASTDLGMEAALALEDVTLGFQKRLDTHRRAFDETATRQVALAATELINHGLQAGIVDGASMADLVKEGRRYCALAVKLDPASADEIALVRARLELAVLRPDIALAVLEHALPTASPKLQRELRWLRDEVAEQTRRRPIEEAPALLPFRRPLPSPPSRPESEPFYPAEAGQLA